MQMSGAALAVESQSTVRPIYDLAGNPIADGDTGNGIVRYRVYGPGIDEPLAEVAASQLLHPTSYLHHDALGSIACATDFNGSVLYRNSYRAFGQNTFAPKTTDTNYYTRLSYTSRENSVGGMYQYRSRYYDPGVGRFAQQDSYKGSIMKPPSLHCYVYVMNSPINLVDPNGDFAADEMFFTAAEIALRAAVVFALMGVASKATMGWANLGEVFMVALGALAELWKYVRIEKKITDNTNIPFGIITLPIIALIFFARVFFIAGAAWLGHSFLHAMTRGAAFGDGATAADAIMAAVAYSIAIALIFAAIDDFVLGNGDQKGYLEEHFRLEAGIGK